MRTTVNEVKQILDDTQLTDPVITAYIGTSNTFVDENLLSTSLSAAMLTEIEKWLTAHLITISRERMAAKEEAGGARIEYIGAFGAGLSSTPYGQTAIALDNTGTLLALSNGTKSIKIVAL